MASQSNLIPGSGYGNLFVDSLVSGNGWQAGPVTFAFGTGVCSPNSGNVAPFIGYDWSPAQWDAVLAAMDEVSAVCGLAFEGASPGNANVVWWLADDSALGTGTASRQEAPNGSFTQAYGYFNRQAPAFDNPVPGSKGFVTILQQVGHAVGLADPHNGGDHADATRFPGVSGEFAAGRSGANQGIWTAMSHNAGWSAARPASTEYGYQQSFMALDIAALQAIYGANASYNTGDDTYQLPAVQGAGTGWSCLWDAGGTDTISNAGSSTACTINLAQATLTGSNPGGVVSRVAGITGGFTIAHNVTIENATGGSGKDTLVGNAAANVLDGGAGNDTLVGGAGNDTYIVDNLADVVTERGGGGIDTIHASVTRTLGSNVENLVLTGSAAINGIGNGLANAIAGNDAGNLLSAAGGADTLTGAGGADTLTGGAGADTFVFASLSDSAVGAGTRDTITDFRPLQLDRIDLSAIDADTAQGGDQAFSFVGGAAFSGHAGELQLVGSLLAGDVDGDGAADFEIQLTGVTVLTGAAFIA